MRKRGAGKIVNISSVGGKIYTPLGSWYYATKHALEGWSDALRWELKHFGIDVIIVEPGLIRTEFGDVMRGPLLEYSGGSAYGGIVKRLTERTKKYDGGSPPSVIADTVLKAVRAKRPRTRYATGRYAEDGAPPAQTRQRPDVRPAHGPDGRAEAVRAGDGRSG